MTIFNTFVVAGVMALGASSVMAAEYTFDLRHTSYGGDTAVWSGGSSFTITDGDMEATFTAGAFKNPVVNDDIFDSTSLVGGKLERWYSGAGVTHYEGDGQHTVDGINSSGNYFDFISVSFTYMGEVVDVMLTSLDFGYVTAGSDFALIGDLSGDGAIGAGDEILVEAGVTSPYTFGAPPEGSIFAVAAPSDSSWKLRTVGISYVPPMNEVPLPAAGWLLLAGVGGLFAARRRSS